MSVHVIVKFGNGQRSMEPITCPLIMTEGEALARGYAELDSRWKVRHTYQFVVPNPTREQLIRPGVYVRVTIPEEGVFDCDLYVARVVMTGDTGGVTMKITAQRYDDWEDSNPSNK